MPSAVVALTGASGAQYAVRLVEALSDASWEVDLIVTKTGAINLHLECDMTAKDLAEIKGVTLHDNHKHCFASCTCFSLKKNEYK